MASASPTCWQAGLLPLTPRSRAPRVHRVGGNQRWSAHAAWPPSTDTGST